MILRQFNKSLHLVFLGTLLAFSYSAMAHEDHDIRDRDLYERETENLDFNKYQYPHLDTRWEDENEALYDSPRGRRNGRNQNYRNQVTQQKSQSNRTQTNKTIARQQGTTTSNNGYYQGYNQQGQQYYQPQNQQVYQQQNQQYYQPQNQQVYQQPYYYQQNPQAYQQPAYQQPVYQQPQGCYYQQGQ